MWPLPVNTMTARQSNHQHHDDGQLESHRGEVIRPSSRVEAITSTA